MEEIGGQLLGGDAAVEGVLVRVRFWGMECNRMELIEQSGVEWNVREWNKWNGVESNGMAQNGINGMEQNRM